MTQVRGSGALQRLLRRAVPTRVLAPCTLALLCVVASGQSMQQYLILRKQFRVYAPAGVEALETLVGSRVLEVKGTVKGTFRVGDKDSLMLQGKDGTTLIVDADAIPEWLVGNETSARLLVRASRADEGEPIRVSLVGAVREQDMAALERRNAEQESTARRREAARSMRKGRGQASWGSESPLFGPIGRGGSHNVGRARQWMLPASQVTPIYAAFIKRENPHLSRAEAIRIAEGIVGFSIQFGVDARLIMAMVMTESGFDPTAVSRTGAVGLGQLMPGTARWMGVSNSYDSLDNLHGTVQLLRNYLVDYKKQTGRDFESLVLSLAAYNAGDGAVRKHGGVPPYRETQAYIRHVINLYYSFAGAG